MPIRVFSETRDGSGVYNIQWPVKFISQQLIGELYDHMWQLRTYGKLPPHMITSLCSTYNVSSDAVKSVYRIAVTQKSIEARRKIPKQVSKEYETTNITDLAAKYDVPPLLLLRVILIDRGYSSTALYHVYKDGSPEKYLHDRDLKQYYMASENDITDIKHQRKVGTRAAAAEKRFVDAFRETGVNIKTQDDLVQEQMKKYGRAVLTPDLLPVDTVYINGKRVNWIDFKSYTLLPNTFIFSSLISQAEKYNKEFGPGAFVFEFGAPNIKIRNTMILTCDAIYGGIVKE